MLSKKQLKWARDSYHRRKGINKEWRKQREAERDFNLKMLGIETAQQRYQRSDKNKQRMKRWRTEHREQILEYRRLWRAKQPKEKIRQEHRKYNLKKCFGLSLEQYDLMLKAQKGRCAICRRPETKYHRKLCVDHDHKTGRIRGLLCIRCNGGLSFFDNRELLDAMTKYLKKYA